jgi:hypothetical protein
MVVELRLISVLVYVSAGVHYIVQLALHHLQIYAFVSETVGITESVTTYYMRDVYISNHALKRALLVTFYALI